jgi:DNA repair protein RadC
VAIPAETPIERIEGYGLRGAPSVDLLAVSLFGGLPEARPTAEALVRMRGGLFGLVELSLAELTEPPLVLPRHRALEFLCALELGRRLEVSGRGPKLSVEGADDVAEILAPLRSEKREHVYVLLLDAKNGLMRTCMVHVGTLNMSLIGPREIFREAIRDGASSIIVVHNHPSGDPEPSPEDLEATAKLAEVGELLDIPLLDHVIMGDRGHVSLRRRGLI